MLRSNAKHRVFPEPRNPGQVISPFFTWIPTTVRRKGGVQNPHGEVRGDRHEREARDLFPRRPGPNVKQAMRNSWQASTQGKDAHADGSGTAGAGRTREVWAELWKASCQLSEDVHRPVQ